MTAPESVTVTQADAELAQRIVSRARGFGVTFGYPLEHPASILVAEFRQSAEAASREREARLVLLLTEAIGDIGAALVMAEREALLGEWTKDYVAAINEHDARAALAHRSQEGEG